MNKLSEVQVGDVVCFGRNPNHYKCVGIKDGELQFHRASKAEIASAEKQAKHLERINNALKHSFRRMHCLPR